uniref:orf261 n=1 Tax=Podospora anserina TaxID=2587412 RepID=UPI000016615E|nr:orf261 [Podospora anserina]
MGLLSYNNSKTNNYLRKHLINARRYYSTYSDSSPDPISTPLPIKIFSNLDNNEVVISYAEILRKKAGIYCFINTVNNKRYIGSAKDLYLRLIEHLAGKKSNIALQNAILKYGLNKFDFCVYEYFTYHSKVVSHKALTDLETSYIEKYPFDSLYNFMRTATSIEGYKHTDEAKLKMLNRFKDKSNHPMYGKKHTEQTLKLISKLGELNPMYGKLHSEETKKKISNSMSKHPYGVGIYDLDDNLIAKFQNNIELSFELLKQYI